MKAYVGKLVGNVVKESSLILAEHLKELQRHARILDTLAEKFQTFATEQGQLLERVKTQQHVQQTTEKLLLDQDNTILVLLMFTGHKNTLDQSKPT